MAKISAHDIFREVKDKIFNLKNKGELEIPILKDNFHVPTEDDILKVYWQGEDKITVAFKGKKRLIPCPITTQNDEYIARCIMQGFAQICLNRNESKERKTISKEDAINVMENTITRLVNEGLMEIDNSDNAGETEEEEKEYHFIWDNDKIILRILHEMCGNCSNYVTCDIDRYCAYVDFGDLYIIVDMNDDGYIYVSKVEGSVLDDKKKSAEIWKEVGECINKINNFNHKLTDLHYGSRNAFESKLRESKLFRNNQNYSHFAINKTTNKIVNGWDYRSYDPQELKQFKNDYFTTDLVDYGLNPKEYKIYTDKYLRKNGIDPDDNNNWANS